MNGRSTGLTPGRILAATCVWLLACALVLFPVWPFLSPTQIRWVLLVVVGPPLYAWGEHLGRELATSRAAQRIPRRRLAVLRILVALGVMLLVYSLVVVGARLIGVAV